MIKVIKKTNIPGCLEIVLNKFQDDRGFFVKIFHKEIFDKFRLKHQFEEEYFSVSHNNVLRGMHFQLPPHEVTKIVYCVLGEVIDVVIDLRANSPTYGKFAQLTLSSQKANMIYIPPGLAHGFYTVSYEAIMCYKVSKLYSQEHDTGILWSSAGIPWQNIKPIISKRDSEFPTLADFTTPFVY
jgi:dTDP-4-dehydrorhamnose 3,5-epimerase